MNKQQKILTAIELFEQFRESEPEFIETVDFDIPEVAVLIGYLDSVSYTTERSGKEEKYIHTFKKKSRPFLCSSHDGKQLLILSGHYDFTEIGIVDY